MKPRMLILGMLLSIVCSCSINDASAPVVTLDDPRITGIPNTINDELSKKDIQILYAGAQYFIETGQADSVNYGTKITNMENKYSLTTKQKFSPSTFHIIFSPEGIPNIQERINTLSK